MGINSSLQEFNLESYQVIFTSASVNLTGTGLTNMINVTETGQLCEIAISYGAVSGTPTVNLEIQIDGQTTQTLSMLAGSGSLTDAAFAFALDDTGNAKLRIPIFTRYKTSCRVGLNVSAAAAGGTYKATVTRGKKI